MRLICVQFRKATGSRIGFELLPMPIRSTSSRTQLCPSQSIQALDWANDRKYQQYLHIYKYFQHVFMSPI